MINNTPMVGSHWNYGSGISVRQQDTVLVPFLGEKEIVFTGICAGGTISTTRKVTIDNILYPIEDEWAILQERIKMVKTGCGIIQVRTMSFGEMAAIRKYRSGLGNDQGGRYG